MSRRTGFILMLGLVVVAAAAAAAGYLGGWSIDDDGRAAPEAIAVSIGAPEAESSTLVWIAEDQGYFEDAGLDMTVMPHAFGRLAAEALLAGEVDLAIASDFVAVRQSFARSDLRILGSVAEINIHDVIGRRDGGLESPADLPGQTIGVPVGSFGEFYLARFLLSHGIEADAVELVDHPPAELADRLIDGSIEVAATWRPHSTRAEQALGDNAVVLSHGLHEPHDMVLLSTAAWVAASPDGAARVMQALAEAAAFIREQPEEARRIVATHLDRDTDAFEALWAGFEFRLSLTQGLLVHMEDQATWMMVTGQQPVGGLPDYLDFVYPEALASVKPEAVTVIH